MTEQELRQHIHKQARVMRDRADEIAGLWEQPLAEMLEAVLSKTGTLNDEAFYLWNDVMDWREQQKREKNGD